MIGGLFRKSLILGLVALLGACGGPETVPNFDDTGRGSGIVPFITLTIVEPISGLESNQGPKQVRFRFESRWAMSP
ncbi:MAG: hypothetical protein CNE99_09505 [OM182 bacterium MED-G24]|uniref:Uncharacterized protein n=1 Tax=OM182 bacterium MED-G24 TaxID=1986255 RepID=A0A2A5WJY8_9GAMM|nr:MAG: hypothetical protein CNE99_09505 [OM182 bacterium MED-G24]